MEVLAVFTLELNINMTIGLFILRTGSVIRNGEEILNSRRNGTEHLHLKLTKHLNLTEANFGFIAFNSAYSRDKIGPVPRSGCLLSQVNSSHPVQALLESFTVLSGCASKGTAGLPQEVHILNVRNAEDSGHHEREVVLHLNPIASMQIHQKPLVFLLNSPVPLSWKVKTERLALGIQRLFIRWPLQVLLSWWKLLLQAVGPLTFMAPDLSCWTEAGCYGNYNETSLDASFCGCMAF
ncbi:Transforming growth factor beta receptor type 3, partial [Ophiophagus hannah]